MPSRRNGRSSRRWYHRICLTSSADSSSESETQDFDPPTANIDDDQLVPLPETLNPAIEDATPHASHSASEYDWQFLPPPPPPPFMLDQLPQRHMRNHDQVRQIRICVTEISGVEDDHREVVRNMKITEAITRERTVCPICKEEFKLGEVAGKLPCDHFFCFECIHGWLNFNQNDTCPVCRRRLPPRDYSRSRQTAVPPPPANLDDQWQYFFPPVSPLPVLTESQLVADETESSPSPSPSINNSEAGYDTAHDELEGSHDLPQDSLASTPTTVFP